MSSFNVNADLVPLFRGLVTGLQPFAHAQQVRLVFETEVEHLYASYNPAEALSEVTDLLSRIITFTPQSYSVTVTVGSGRGRPKSGEGHPESSEGHPKNCILTIENTGVDLSRVIEILSSVNKGLQLEKLPKATRFTLRIPITDDETSHSSGTSNEPANSDGAFPPKPYPFYYSAVSKRLASHFSNAKNLKNDLSQMDVTESVFIKKVNAVIHAKIDDPEFKVDALSDAMALSRSQLFRKLKALTRMSPQKYLRFVRLERAKEMLQSRSIDLNVSEVCYRTGFTSKSHFTRAFRKEYGFCPSEVK